MPERCVVGAEVCLSEASESRKWRMFGYHMEPPERKITATVRIECLGEHCARRRVFKFTREGSAPEVMADGSYFGDTALGWARIAMESSCLRLQ